MSYQKRVHKSYRSKSGVVLLWGKATGRLHAAFHGKALDAVLHDEYHLMTGRTTMPSAVRMLFKTRR
jgi:hypothetical protein